MSNTDDLIEASSLDTENVSILETFDADFSDIDDTLERLKIESIAASLVFFMRESPITKEQKENALEMLRSLLDDLVDEVDDQEDDEDEDYEEDDELNPEEDLDDGEEDDDDEEEDEKK
jgi:hypothetical protein